MAHYNVNKYVKFLLKYKVDLPRLPDTLEALNVPPEIRSRVYEAYSGALQKERDDVG